MAAENQSEVQKYFEATRDAYTRWGGETRAIHFGFHSNPSHPSNHFDSLTFMNDRLIRMLGVGDGTSILDAGCGYGSTLVRAAQTVGARGVGITICADQVQQAQEFVQSVGLGDKVAVLLEDFTETHFADGIFDGVVMCESLAHAPNKSVVLAEMSRVLKPGGKLVIADYFLLPHFGDGDSQSLKEFQDGWACYVIPLVSFASDVFTHGLIVSMFENVTTHVLPSLEVAAASARDHNGDNSASEERIRHRLATCRIAEMMAQGKMGYFITVLKKTL